jgi:hypothetical protein
VIVHYVEVAGEGLYDTLVKLPIDSVVKPVGTPVGSTVKVTFSPNDV